METKEKKASLTNDLDRMFYDYGMPSWVDAQINVLLLSFQMAHDLCDFSYNVNKQWKWICSCFPPISFNPIWFFFLSSLTYLAFFSRWCKPVSTKNKHALSKRETQILVQIHTQMDRHYSYFYWKSNC